MIYLSVLGRQPEISLAELEAFFSDVQQISENLAIFKINAPSLVEKIPHLGGSLKIAEKLEVKPLDYLANLSDGKITIGVSDYSKNASRKTAVLEGLKLKKILVRHGRSVRIVENKDAILSTATSLHNGLSGKNEKKLELIKVNNDWYRVIHVQDIDAYAKRDQARPARDTKVGMLPPKLAQILINLCGPLSPNSVILDPFCGTGVVLQEALLMGYRAYGTDISERMIKYSEQNLRWLASNSFFEGSAGAYERGGRSAPPVTTGRRDPVPEKKLFEDEFKLSVGNATSFKWQQPINAVACEGYLGKPFSKIPTEIELKEQKQECKTIILGFLKNIKDQVETKTPMTIAVPAWLREDDSYSRLNIIDEIENMGYNVNNKSREGLLYYRKGQIVARDILILRKK